MQKFYSQTFSLEYYQAIDLTVPLRPNRMGFHKTVFRIKLETKKYGGEIFLKMFCFISLPVIHGFNRLFFHSWKKISKKMFADVRLFKKISKKKFGGEIKFRIIFLVEQKKLARFDF